jgi:hypothetical protein
LVILAINAKIARNEVLKRYVTKINADEIFDIAKKNGGMITFDGTTEVGSFCLELNLPQYGLERQLMPLSAKIILADLLIWDN